MIDSLRIEGPTRGNGDICRTILADLPEWFGIPEANQNYAQQTEIQPTFTATLNDEPVGFLTVLLHGPESAEIYVLGVLKKHHGNGIGQSLLKAAESYLRSQGIRFLQVKTLAALASDANYERTRAFYEGQGFVTLEVFTDLWDENNPCLQLIKGL